MGSLKWFSLEHDPVFYLEKQFIYIYYIFNRTTMSNLIQNDESTPHAFYIYLYI